MNYREVISQWNKIIDEVQRLQEGISECINGEHYENEQQKHDLKVMRKGCYELQRILLGYFD